MRSEVGQALDEIRLEIAEQVAPDVMPDTCLLIVDEDEYPDTHCKLKGGGGNIDGAPYRIRFAWGSPAVIGAAVVVDEIEGRAELTLQLVEPLDSSTGVWQEWKATSGPAYGRQDVGL
jgi:hypothetical protein